MNDFDRRRFRDVGAELRVELGDVVGEECGLMARARDGDIAETGVEQVWVNAGVGIDQNALCGESLRTVAGDCVAVIEMAMLLGVEFDAPVVVEAGGNLPIRRDRLDDGKVAIGDAKRLVRSSELDAVAGREVMRDFPIDADAGEAAWVVIGSFTRGFLDRKQVGGRVDADYCSIFSCFDSGDLAPTRIADDIIDLIASWPRNVRRRSCPGAGRGLGSCDLPIAMVPLAFNSCRTAAFNSRREALSGETMSVFSGDSV